jgi:nucleoside-diphosphate-sugar epimerase
MPLRYLVTGATGFIGGHVAEACRARGHAVSTIGRPTSDTLFLERLDVTIHRGDLGDAQLFQKVVADADVIVHCAAKVGDRGPVEEYRAVNVEALRSLLESCRGKALKRFVHISSLGVYEARDHYGTDETEPIPVQHLDGYTQSKAEAELVAWQYQREHGVPVVLLRPGFVYGPRDKTVLPKLINRMRTSKIHYLGADRKALNTIYIGNLIDAIFLVADNPKAVGQAYNLTDGEAVSKRRFVESIADAMGLKKPKQLLPRWLGGVFARMLRREILRAGQTGKSRLTPAQFKFLLLNLDFSIDKAKRELGYCPRVSFDQGMRETMAWYLKNA